jgi:hypothetical protein
MLARAKPHSLKHVFLNVADNIVELLLENARFQKADY